MEFKVSSRAKKVAFGLIIVGLIGTALGFITEKSYIHTSLNEETGELSMIYHGHNNGENSEQEWKKFQEDLIAAASANYIVINDGAHAGHGDHGDDHADHTEHMGGQLMIEEPEHGGGGDHGNTEHDGGHEGHGDHEGHGHHIKYTWNVTATHAHTKEGLNTWHHASEGDEIKAVKSMVDSREIGMSDGQHNRFWSSLLVNGFFFFGISLGALFYLALHYATESGWGAIILRVFEGVMLVLPFGALVLLIVFLAATFDFNHIYMWMNDSAKEWGPDFDKLLFKKDAYLNNGFFWIRTLAYIATFLGFAWYFRKLSKKEDQEGGTRLHFLQYRRGALFLVFFAVFSSTLAWDWIMSIDAHWFSTLFGWYVFSGIWISAMIMILITTMYLKSRGFLPQVNQSHIHDLSKWIFAISFLWSYLWFSQFMLIWYSNIGEEIVYFQQRIMDYKFLFFGTFAVNFILPMVLLMSRDAKRTWSIMIVVGSIIFLGHWMDVYLMVMPGSVMGKAHLGILEGGMFVLFLGIFIFLLLNNLKKAPLIKKNHPMLEESVHHDF